jgi:diamine N-acetyltransferase
MIKGDKIDLRLIKEGDLEFLRQVRNAYSERFFTHDYITKAQQKRWYSKYSESGGTDLMFIIQLKDGTQIGTIAVYNIDLSSRIADFGRMLILQEYEGQGYAKEATNLMVEFSFKTLKLWKIKLQVFLDNAKSIGIYNSCGFEAFPRPVMLMEATNRTESYKEPLELPGWMEG